MIPIEAQVKEIAREVKLRETVYPRWVAHGRMTQAQADDQLGALRAALETLLALMPPEPQQRGLFEKGGDA